MIRRIIDWFYSSLPSFKEPSPYNKLCYVCERPLVREEYTKREPVFDSLLLECPTKHYRVHYQNGEPESDYADADGFCVRRFFIHGFSDVIARNHLDRRDKVTYTIEKIVTRVEAIRLIDKYKKLTIIL